ncbi:MAG TPA: BadF/BadG/BcrA/BcrD ATPase family protein [Marmoricola sp.]
MTDRLVLAVDGGNSKTDVVLVDEGGRALAHVRGPGSSPHRLTVAGTVDLLDELVLKAAAQAGLPPTQPVAALGEVYLAGVDFPSEKETVAAAVRARSWAPEVEVDNDTFALLRAGTDAPDAVAVVCGAGINCVGVSADGRHARFASLGRLSGDWGGGGELGEEALWWAARAVDGRGPRTALSTLVPRFFGLPDTPAVYEAIHFGRLDHRRLIELAPVVLEASRDGDEVARGVVCTLAQEVVTMARAAMARLDMLAVPTVVVLGGGVLAGRDPVLLAEIDQRLAGEAPQARTVVTEVSPVVGAALLGLDRLGADAAVKQRLRAQLPITRRSQ